MRRLLVLSAGWLFVVLGLAGLVLPFLQGFLFLGVGLFLLSLESARARLLRQRIATRYPRIGARMARIQTKVRGWLRRNVPEELPEERAGDSPGDSLGEPREDPSPTPSDDRREGPPG